MSEGAATIAPEGAPQAVENAEQSAQQTAPEQTGAAEAENDPFFGAMAALGVDPGVDAPESAPAPQPAGDPAAAAEDQDAAPETDEAGSGEAADDLPAIVEDGRVVVKSGDAIIVDPDGNEWRAQDVIWRTSQYHRKLAEKDAELKQTLAKVQELDAELQTDPAGLARKIISVADPAARLAAVADVLRETGLPDVADQVAALMNQNGLQYDPIQAERARLERERAEFEAQRRQAEVQARINSELQALTSELGREITDREWETIAEVAEAHNLRYPDQPLSLRDAYDKAARLLRIEEAERRAVRQQAKPKPATTIEPAVATGATQQGGGGAMDYIDGALAALGID